MTSVSRRSDVPCLAVSLGCPSGIGPEVSVLAALKASWARPLLVGDARVVERAARQRGVDPGRFVRVAEPADVHSLPRRQVGVWQPTPSLLLRDVAPGRPSSAAGSAQLAWIDAACDLVRSGGAAALVTGPVSKSVIAGSGGREAARFLGHTEHLQRRLGAAEVVMAFACDKLTTALVTTHVPIARLPREITQARVASATFWLADLLFHLGGPKRAAHVAVASLNPHAGEGGLLGREEQTVLVPGMALARSRAEAAGVRAEIVGPVPAETAFRVAARGGYDGVVAMYHDQATIPMKLIGFGEAVNVSLGLPIIRTSVDHGTGYDIAGKGVADPRAMIHAMRLAVRLAGGAPRSATAPRRAARRPAR
jgi:4-hydroxythreonine-4-phosphate dehydrogenase